MKQINLKLVIPLIILVAVILYLRISSGALFGGADHSNCKAREKALDTYFEGILVSKFKDENNHLYETLEIKTPEGNIKTTILVLEKSELFERLKVGSVLTKKRNSLELNIDASNTVYVMNFGCDKITN